MLFSSVPELNAMRVKEMKKELESRGVPFIDCFDRESLSKRLEEARLSGASVEVVDEEDESSSSSGGSKIDTDNNTQQSSQSSPSPSSLFNREDTLQRLRTLRVSELRTEMSSRAIRWANMFEKEELVVALTNAMEQSHSFSVSGKLTPGKVADISEEDLEMEFSSTTGTGTPLLLDVYATWCGPCQMMAPELEEAAKVLQGTVRVAKLDSDKYPRWASKLKVGGLPTVIVFDAQGNEVKRVEGALPRQGLLDLAKEAL